MSLSFVKSAVLSSTDGVSHNEETTIDNKETQSLRANNSGGPQKPLFEQLRANKDAEQEKDEEFQRSIRGTRPLDEEDCAHLDAIERRRNENEHEVKNVIEREVALFHAAREDRGLAQTVVMEGEEEEGDRGDDGGGAKDGITRVTINTTAEPVIAKSKEVKKKNIVPKFTIKKKRKLRAAQQQKPALSNKNRAMKNKQQQPAIEKKKSTNETTCEANRNEASNNIVKAPSEKAANDSDSDNEGGGLLGLGCYGSDSD
mmetsp:Transcript_23742/g.42715  ORF Transcript_23742/g.42715 Transcript_23742/m.42715 type:complete len:258 (+) Transcript_23742:181-954(+)